MSPLVTINHEGSTAILTICRADKRNALSRALIAELSQAFTVVRDDERVRAVILTGDGPAFCAGMDLAELRETLQASEEIIWTDAVHLASLFELIYRFPKLTIAAINGHAVAGGCGLVTVCDLAVSVPSAKFGYPEVRRGLVAAIVMPHLLRHVGERAARQMLLTGELVSANDAQQMRLINEVVPPEELLKTALAWASQGTLGGPRAIAVTKQLLSQFSVHAMSIEEVARESAAPRLGAEGRAGLEAFFAQKSPPWV